MDKKCAFFTMNLVIVLYLFNVVIEESFMSMYIYSGSQKFGHNFLIQG